MIIASSHHSWRIQITGCGLLVILITISAVIIVLQTTQNTSLISLSRSSNDSTRTAAPLYTYMNSEYAVNDRSIQLITILLSYLSTNLAAKGPSLGEQTTTLLHLHSVYQSSWQIIYVLLLAIPFMKAAQNNIQNDLICSTKNNYYS